MPFSEAQRAWMNGIIATRGGKSGGAAPGATGGRPPRAPSDDDDEIQPTPMALPEDKPKGKAKKQKGVVDMEPMDLDPNADSPEDRQALKDAKSQALKDFNDEADKNAALVESAITRGDALRANYGVMIHGACLLFQGYAKKKLDEMKGEPDPFDLLGPVLGIGLGIMFSELSAAMALEEFGKMVVEKTLDGIKEATIKTVEGALKKDFKSLEAAVDEIVSQGVMAGDRMGNAAIGAIRVPLNGMVQQFKARKPLTPAQEDLLKLFKGKSVDEALQSMGLPMDGTAKNVQAKLYRGMVKAFEVQRITYNRKEADLDPDPRGVNHAADLNADEAVKQLPSGEGQTSKT